MVIKLNLIKRSILMDYSKADHMIRARFGSGAACFIAGFAKGAGSQRPTFRHTFSAGEGFGLLLRVREHS